MAISYNPHKVVTLVRGDGVTWGSILSSSIESSTGDYKLVATTSNFNVDEKVIPLLMVNQLEGQGTHNNFDHPMQSLTKDVTSLLPGRAGEIVEGTLNITKAIIAGTQSFSGGETGTGANWNPWYQSVPAWDSPGKGVTFDYSFEFAMGQYGLWDAKEEVFKPVLNLISTAFPRAIGAVTSSGPYPNVMSLIKHAFLSIRGEKDSLDISDLDSLGNALEALIINSYKNFTYDISFGGTLKFHKMLIKDTSYEFSTDTDARGYPIWGRATLSFEGMVPAALSYNQEATSAFSVRE